LAPKGFIIVPESGPSAHTITVLTGITGIILLGIFAVQAREVETKPATSIAGVAALLSGTDFLKTLNLSSKDSASEIENRLQGMQFCVTRDEGIGFPSTEGETSNDRWVYVKLATTDATAPPDLRSLQA
jgi:hypothetical protein